MAGHRIAYALQREAEVILVDPKDFLEVPMASPRMLVEPGRSRDALIGYAEFLPGVQHVQGLLKDVSNRSVSVKTCTGQTIDIPFDYLVLATGASYPQHDTIKATSGNRADRMQHFADWARRIADAPKITVIGGGAVGVEIAAEILDEYPGKNLSLVSRSAELLEGTTRGPRRFAERFLRERGARLTLNAASSGEDHGDEDVVLACHGYRIDTGYMRNNFANSLEEPSGRVRVTETLTVAGVTDRRMFAAGDITNLAEPKLGLWAGKHAETIAENLRILMSGKKSALRTYRPATGSQMMVVTLGRRHGTGHLPMMDFTNSWVAQKLKSEDMLIGRYRKRIGLG